MTVCCLAPGAMGEVREPCPCPGGAPEPATPFSPTTHLTITLLDALPCRAPLPRFQDEGVGELSSLPLPCLPSCPPQPPGTHPPAFLSCPAPSTVCLSCGAPCEGVLSHSGAHSPGRPPPAPHCRDRGSWLGRCGQQAEVNGLLRGGLPHMSGHFLRAQGPPLAFKVQATKHDGAKSKCHQAIRCVRENSHGSDMSHVSLE